MFSFKFYEFYNKKKDCKAIKAVSSYEGKTVIGVAELHPDDTFDTETGNKIAMLRCQKKLCKKKIARFRRKSQEIDADIEFYENYIKQLRKRKDAYKKTICETECLMMESDAALEKILNS